MCLCSFSSECCGQSLSDVNTVEQEACQGQLCLFFHARARSSTHQWLRAEATACLQCKAHSQDITDWTLFRQRRDRDTHTHAQCKHKYTHSLNKGDTDSCRAYRNASVMRWHTVLASCKLESISVMKSSFRLDSKLIMSSMTSSIYSEEKKTTENHNLLDEHKPMCLTVAISHISTRPQFEQPLLPLLSHSADGSKNTHRSVFVDDTQTTHKWWPLTLSTHSFFPYSDGQQPTPCLRQHRYNSVQLGSELPDDSVLPARNLPTIQISLLAFSIQLSPLDPHNEKSNWKHMIHVCPYRVM